MVAILLRISLNDTRKKIISIFLLEIVKANLAQWYSNVIFVLVLVNCGLRTLLFSSNARICFVLQVRRTVKFLCGLASGQMIVQPQWLTACKKAKHFIGKHCATLESFSCHSYDSWGKCLCCRKVFVHIPVYSLTQPCIH